MAVIYSSTSTVKVDSVSKLMQQLAYRDNRFLATLINPTPAGTKADPAVKDPLNHKWVNERFKSARGKLEENISSAATSVKVNNAYTNIIANKTNLIIDDEVLVVTAVSYSSGVWTCTVTRGGLSTTAATHKAGDLVKIERIWDEGEDAANYDSDGGAFSTNYCQIFRTDVKLTGSAAATKTYTDENNIEKQVIQKIPTLFQQIEGACFHVNAPYSSGNTRIMAGMPYYIANGMKRDNGGNAFSLATLADDVEELAYNGVDPSRLLMVAGRGVLASINNIKAGLVQETMKIRELDFNVKSIVVPGENTIKLAPLCTAVNPNEYYLYDKDSVQLKFLRALATEDLAKTGDSDRKMVVTEAVLECHNWQQGGAIRRTNIA